MLFKILLFKQIPFGTQNDKMLVKQLLLLQQVFVKCLLPYLHNFLLHDRGGFFPIIEILKYSKFKNENLSDLTEISSNSTFPLIVFLIFFFPLEFSGLMQPSGHFTAIRRAYEYWPVGRIFTSSKRQSSFPFRYEKFDLRGNNFPQIKIKLKTTICLAICKIVLLLLKLQ